MKNSTKKKEEQQNSSESWVERPLNNHSLSEIEREFIEETPFVLVRDKHKTNWFIAIGNTKVSLKEFETISEAKKYINKKPWELIGQLMFSIINHIDNFKK